MTTSGATTSATGWRRSGSHADRLGPQGPRRPRSPPRSPTRSGSATTPSWSSSTAAAMSRRSSGRCASTGCSRNSWLARATWTGTRPRVPVARLVDAEHRGPVPRRSSSFLPSTARSAPRGRRRPLRRRRQELSVHGDHRGRGRDPGSVGRGADPARPLGVRRRAQPADRPDRLPDRRRDRADALHRRRPQELRTLLFEDPDLADLLLSAFVARRELLQGEDGLGIEMIGPRSSERDAGDRRVAEERPDPVHAGATRAPRTPATRGGGADRGARPEQLPLVRLPGRRRAARPRRNGELSRALGIGLRAAPTRGGRPADRRRRPRRARRGRLRRLGGPRHPGARAHGPRRPGRHLAADRELPGLPGRDRRQRAHQPGRHPGAQVRRPDRDPLRAVALEPDGERHVVRVEDGQRDRRARRRDRDRRRLPPAAGRAARRVRGDQRLLRRRPAGGAAAAAAAAWASSAAATRPPRPRSGWPAEAPWSRCFTGAPTSARRCPTT